MVAASRGEQCAHSGTRASLARASDAYQLNRTITAEEAEEYHSDQLATLGRARVDLIEAMTF